MEWLDAARSGGCTLLVWFAFNSRLSALHRRGAKAGLNCSLNENSRSSQHRLTPDGGRLSQPSLRDSVVPAALPTDGLHGDVQAEGKQGSIRLTQPRWTND